MVLRDVFEAHFFEGNPQEPGGLFKFSGTRMLGGPGTIEISPDTFVVPVTRKTGYEDRSVFFFEQLSDTVHYLRIWIDKIEPELQKVLLTSMHLEWKF